MVLRFLLRWTRFGIPVPALTRDALLGVVDDYINREGTDYGHRERTIDEKVESGPNAVFSFKREGYGKTDFSLADSWDALSYPGLWKMFFKYWRYGLCEYARTFSKKLFLKQLQRLIPSLQDDDIKPCKAGIRAQALLPNGEPIEDFKIERKGNSIHVLNAPSPAATASLAIGDTIAQIATDYFKLEN